MGCIWEGLEEGKGSEVIIIILKKKKNLLWKALEERIKGKCEEEHSAKLEAKK